MDQRPAQAVTALVGMYCNQQQFNFRSGAATEREALRDAGGIERLAGKAAVERQRAAQLQRRPGFAKARIETGPHYRHQRVDMTGVGWSDDGGDRGGHRLIHARVVLPRLLPKCQTL